jgi:hypothetical protein
MKIAFHSNQLSLRGSEIASYDYSSNNETLLGNESIILSKHPDIQPLSHPLAIKKFEDRFGKDKVFYYYDFHNDGEKILKEQGVDVLYCIKSGENDGIVSHNANIKTVVHAVFQHNSPHGHRYCFVSKWLAGLYNGRFVPHMVDLPMNIKDNLRDELGIPKNALVYLRYGGKETFDLGFVHQAIYDIVRKRDDIYFIFMYTNKFCPDHKQILHVDGDSSLEFKVKLINTCDSGIHGRLGGESFGLFCAELSTLNKPNITWNNGRDQAHLEMLGDKCYKYNNYQDLYNIIMNFQSDSTKDWNAYRDYTPEKVMKIFEQEFLK